MSRQGTVQPIPLLLILIQPGQTACTVVERAMSDNSTDLQDVYDLSPDDINSVAWGM